MPLLMCPNDNAPMQTVERSGVQFDMCPTCRGVWLDRGELDKIIERSAAVSPQPEAPLGRPEDYRRGDRYEGDRYERGYGDRRYRKRKSFLDELFDFD